MRGTWARMVLAVPSRSWREEPERRASGTPTLTPVPNATSSATHKMHHCLLPNSTLNDNTKKKKKNETRIKNRPICKYLVKFKIII